MYVVCCVSFGLKHPYRQQRLSVAAHCVCVLFWQRVRASSEDTCYCACCSLCQETLSLTQGRGETLQVITIFCLVKCVHKSDIHSVGNQSFVAGSSSTVIWYPFPNFCTCCTRLCAKPIKAKQRSLYLDLYPNTFDVGSISPNPDARENTF